MARFEDFDSALEEIRSLDGELFRSELSQRLYLTLKTHAVDSLRSARQKGAEVYGKIITSYLNWSPVVREEELETLRSRQSDLDELWMQVATLYVRMSHRSTEARVVRIRTPSLDELVQQFFRWILKQPPNIWDLDPIKLDFCTREAFRCAVMDSVHLVDLSANDFALRAEDAGTVYPNDSVSRYADDDDATTVVSIKPKTMKEAHEEAKEVARQVLEDQSAASAASAASEVSQSEAPSKASRASKASEATEASARKFPSLPPSVIGSEGTSVTKKSGRSVTSKYARAVTAKLVTLSTLPEEERVVEQPITVKLIE